MEFLLQYSRFIIEGFITALTMTIIGVSGGAILGIITALLDVYRGRVSKVLVGIYVEFFRGSPLIVQLLIFYFSIPAITGLNWDAYTAGAITLILNSGAYQKGYFKGAVEAVFKDQLMAAASIGLTFRQTLRHIVLPQALRIVIPAWTNELVSLGLSTSALIIIGVRELTSIAKTIAAQTFRPLEVYFTIAIIYFIWITIMLKIMDIVYRRVRIPGLEVSI